jgi:prepilin-type N-terminal cleavage/methylation domain-containing protein
MSQRDLGYTLVELVVVMMVFSIVMTLISTSFNRIVSSSGQMVKSGETDISGLIGLEVFRSDLELAGFGLCWSLPADGSLTYVETTKGSMVQGCNDGCPGTNAASFNDTSPNSQFPTPPRAYIVANNAGFNGSDYLVLKGTALGTSSTCRQWAYLNYSSTGAVVKQSKSEVELATGHSDRTVVVKTGQIAGVPQRQLVTNGSSFTLVYNKPLTAFLPQVPQDNYLVYGVDDASDDGTELKFPYNRADYYLSENKADDGSSASCAPHTGVLYKTLFIQPPSSSSKTTTLDYPLLDCVADMQVVLYMDTNGDGEIDYHPTGTESYSATALRSQLKEIRVYILAQQGKYDPRYLYPINDPKTIVVGDEKLGSSQGKWWSSADLAQAFGPNWQHYHWKVYTIVVQPKNL